MFTIKVFHPGGSRVLECDSYGFVHGTYNPDGTVETIDRLEVFKDGQDASVVRLGADTVYVMNSHGKTIDDFRPYPPDHAMRIAVSPPRKDIAPDAPPLESPPDP